MNFATKFPRRYLSVTISSTITTGTVYRRNLALHRYLRTNLFMKEKDQDIDEPNHETMMLLTITASNEIRSQLSTNEEGYFLFRKLLSLVSVRDRAHYLYSVLDEVERVGLALMRAKEMFDDTDSSNSDDLEGQRLCRNLNASIQSELALYI